MRTLKVIAQFTGYILLGFCTASANVLLAQTTENPSTESSATKEAKTNSTGESEFLGLGFSAGISLTIDGGVENVLSLRVWSMGLSASMMKMTRVLE